MGMDNNKENYLGKSGNNNNNLKDHNNNKDKDYYRDDYKGK